VFAAVSQGMESRQEVGFMSSAERLTGALAGSGGLVVGFLTGRWIAARIRSRAPSRGVARPQCG
jgi:hypothetical protein